MSRPTTHEVRGAALRAVAYPVRLEVVEALLAHQPATVEELGRALGREPKSLYHHLRPLVSVGLVLEAGERPSSKRPAKLYRLPADRLRIDYEDMSPAARRARMKIGKVILHAAFKWHVAALDDPATVIGGPHATVAMGQRVVRLKPRGRARVIKKLYELYQLLGEQHDEDGAPFALTMHLAPIYRDRPRS